MNGDLQSLISAACDNRASTAELARLREMLRDDTAVVDEYLRYVDLHSALADETLPPLESDIINYKPEATASPSFGREASKRARYGWPLAIVALVAIVAGVSFLVLDKPADNIADGPDGISVVASPPVATLLFSENCHWQEDDLTEGQRLIPGQMDLESGTAVLRFDGGAELILVGPAAIDLQTSASVLVHRGNVVVRATAGAEGFVVTTPTSEVVDLGTEFAVKVANSGTTEVHVLDGKVSCRGINAAEELAKILRAGEGIEIDENGQPRAVPMNSPRFQEFVNRVNPRSRADMLSAYEGFNYSPGRLPLEQSTVGKGWAGPWRKRLPKEKKDPAEDETPDNFEIVHGQMNVTWPVPGGRLGMLKLAAGDTFYVRALERSIELDEDSITFFSLMVRETGRPADSQRSGERLRLTFRSSTAYFAELISFGHSSGYQPHVQTGEGISHTSPMVLPAEQTTLWIGKIVSRAHGEDEICFRVYGEEDVLGYVEPATWHVVTRDVELDAHLDRVLLSSTGDTARIVDELRIGPTWRSVAPMLKQQEIE